MEPLRRRGPDHVVIHAVGCPDAPADRPALTWQQALDHAEQPGYAPVCVVRRCPRAGTASARICQYRRGLRSGRFDVCPAARLLGHCDRHDAVAHPVVREVAVEVVDFVVDEPCQALAVGADCVVASKPTCPARDRSRAAPSIREGPGRAAGQCPVARGLPAVGTAAACR
ncbi:hypothetical protein ABZ766_06480 [Streptomyces sp. NPDC006670]|uniref:hypothetical protein n=1 Tax=Streptomyces sp. NPDC006670 TaxID=3154476 RepID=UPI003406F01C